MNLLWLLAGTYVRAYREDSHIKGLLADTWAKVLLVVVVVGGQECLEDSCIIKEPIPE